LKDKFLNIGLYANDVLRTYKSRSVTRNNDIRQVYSHYKKSSSILGIKQLNVLERNAVRGGTSGHHDHDHTSSLSGDYHHDHDHSTQNNSI